MSARERLGREPAAPAGRHGSDGGRAPVGPERSQARAAPAEPALVLDPIACVGHGLCAELFPEGVVLDDWGYPIVLHEAEDPALRAHARRAVKACPALALRLRARG